MTPRLQRRIQRYGWDKAAIQYDTGWKNSLKEAQTLLLNQAAARPGDHVLDMACGTGLVTFPLAKAVGKRGRVVATDISEQMINIVRKEATQRELTQITAVRAGAEDHTAFENNRFDLVTCALGLMYVPSPQQVLSEVIRMLKPHGQAVFAVWGARENCGWADIFPIVDARVESEVCPMFFHLGNRDVLAMLMKKAGFADVRVQRLSTFLAYKSEKDALNAAFVGGPVALAYNRFDEDTRLSAHADYLKSISPYLTKSGYRIPGEFVVCSGKYLN